MNYAVSDRAIVERAESDIRTTMAFLKARIVASFSDLQTVRHKSLVIEEAGKSVDNYTQDLIGDLIGWTEKQIPEADEYRGDRIAGDREVARHLNAAE